MHKAPFLLSPASITALSVSPQEIGLSTYEIIVSNQKIVTLQISGDAL